MEQNAVELLRFGWPLRYSPRLILDDVLVHPRNQLPDILKTPREVVVVEVPSIVVDDASRKFTHLGIAGGGSGRWNTACAIFRNHGHRAAEEIAEIVSKITVVTLNDRIEREITVLTENHLAEDVIAQELRSKNLVENEWVHNVPTRLRHLDVLG